MTCKGAKVKTGGFPCCDCELCILERCRASLGPRPSPLRDLLRAFNCTGEGNIENGEA